MVLVYHVTLQDHVIKGLYNFAVCSTLLAVHPKTVTRRKKFKKTRIAIAKLFALRAKAIQLARNCTGREKKARISIYLPSVEVRICIKIVFVSVITPVFTMSVSFFLFVLLIYLNEEAKKIVFILNKTFGSLQTKTELENATSTSHTN